MDEESVEKVRDVASSVRGCGCLLTLLVTLPLLILVCYGM